MTKRSKGKPIKEVVFATRNKAVIIYSRLFGSEKTNEILDKTFSNNIIVSKLLEAEKHGFEIIYGQEENKKGIGLFKEINKKGIDVTKCKKKYWDTVTENLLKLYDEETTDAIIEHYNPPIDKDVISVGNGIAGFDGFVHEDKPDAKYAGICIEFYPRDVEEDSKIEKRIGNKITRYIINWEEISSAFIDSHIQVFG